MDSPARRLLELGLQWYRRGQLEEASALFDAARQCAQTLDEPLVAAEAWQQLGRSSSLSCHPKVAENAFCEAAKRFEAIGESERAMAARLRQTFVAYDANDLERAEDLALAELERAPTPSLARGMALGYRGNIARSRGQLDVACEHYRDAIEVLNAADERLYRAVFEMDLAILRMLELDWTAAWSGLIRAKEIASGLPNDPMLATLLSHYELLTLAGLGEAELVGTRIEHVETLPSTAIDFLLSCHTLIRDLAASPRSRAHETALGKLRLSMPAYEHARLTIRVLRGLLGRPTQPDDRLVVHETEHRVRIGEDLDATFKPESAEWSMIVELARHRRDAHRDALSPEALVAAGWPGERLTPDSAKNRLHVTLSKLRKRGLRDVLLRYPDGYALSPSLEIIFV